MNLKHFRCCVILHHHCCSCFFPTNKNCFCCTAETGLSCCFSCTHSGCSCSAGPCSPALSSAAPAASAGLLKMRSPFLKTAQTSRSRCCCCPLFSCTEAGLAAPVVPPAGAATLRTDHLQLPCCFLYRQPSL